MPKWTDLISQLNVKAPKIMQSLIYTVQGPALEIKYYYCHAVTDLVQFIREKTKAKELGATHHVLKILFRWIVYQDRARLEITKDGRRVDIYVEDTRQEIEVKTISEMKLYELWQKVLGVIESPSHKSDILWVFYFYRVNRTDIIQSSEREMGSLTANTYSQALNGSITCRTLDKPSSRDRRQDCHYLLTFIALDILEQESDSLKQDLMRMVEDSVRQVAKKINTRPELIIPLENLIKVEDLERLVEEKDQALLDKDTIIQKKNYIIQEKDQAIQEKDHLIQEQEKTIRDLRKKINQ